uniref:ATP synthase complex subunit 8 n=1 Tax=Graphosoma rubrolineatum TaxID=295705 RepID=A0A1P8CZZ4_GRARU|nr:ATP synthase F0 subunit 8 [Graphosoma rubrolineatum]API85472.1 ATP synthase F0 subunit 8 [Graphosoma rubrolineatum]
MPQMAPLWWELLFLVFLMTYLIVNNMIYFMPKTSIKPSNHKNKTYNQINWKW